MSCGRLVAVDRLPTAILLLAGNLTAAVSGAVLVKPFPSLSLGQFLLVLLVDVTVVGTVFLWLYYRFIPLQTADAQTRR